MELSVGHWLLAILPVAVLLGGIIFLKWEAARAGAASWLVATVVAASFFGAGARLLTLASCKGVSLSIFVLLILWGAIFLYHIADGAGAIKVIGNTLERVTDDGLLRCLLFTWCFTSLLQGIAGFGVPVAIVAPIMIMMDYSPVTAIAACLVGHSWSISFGSMGSSYITIQLVTGIPGEVIGPLMALLFSISIFSTGLAVSHIHSGIQGVKRGLGYVIPAGAAMAFGLWLTVSIGAPQIASLVAAMCGCVVLIAAGMLRRKKDRSMAAGKSKSERAFVTMCSPYAILIAISILTQIPPIKTALSAFYIGLDYPDLKTAFGHAVAEAEGYAKIMIFSHPALPLCISAMAGYAIYIRAAAAGPELLRQAAASTFRRCTPMSVSISLIVMMALVMIDSGMIKLIAQGSAMIFQDYYGLMAPVIGGLGTLITGSNTNSNIMFGALQYETALTLGKSAVLFAAAQSVGGSLGVAMSPATIMVGVSSVGLNGQEASIMRATAPYCAGCILLTGLAVWLLSRG